MTGKDEEDVLEAPKTNFTSKHSVLIDHPLAEVFPVLARGDKLESVVRLSALCTDFQLLQSDTVQLPPSTPLSNSRVRTRAAHPEQNTTTSSEGFVLPRQFFWLQETVPVFFGLIKKKVEIMGTMTWDDDAKIALYESRTEDGIVTWKLREFVEVEEDGKAKTRVSETIEGSCPGWMRIIVQTVVTKSHREHMDMFHTLY